MNTKPSDDAALKVVLAKVAKLSAPDVRTWLQARLANCRRIASEKTGSDRDGWLDDAAFFAAAVGLIDWTAARESEQ